MITRDGVTVTMPQDTDPNAVEEGQRRQKRDAFLALMRARYETVRNAEGLLRMEMMKDWLFRAGDQWDPEILAARREDDRACLTINRLPQFIRQVTNAQRSANLAVKVSAVDMGADVKTAEVMQGLIRHIEQQSDAQVAYATAGDHQATIGRGYWRIDTEYEDEHSFVQRIRIKRVRNPFTVFMDPAAMEPDGSDARYCLIIEDVPLDEFKARFPGKKVADLSDFETTGITWSWNDWMPTGKCRIAEYWYVEEVQTKVHLVELTLTPPAPDPITGELVPAVTKQIALLEEELSQIDESTPYTIVKSRPVMTKRVKQSLCSAVEVLEGNEDETGGAAWSGKWIPVVPAIGDELDINGRIDLRGMVRDARDPQRLYNYQNSTLAETLAMVPRAPWIGAEGAFENHEVKWREANRRAFPYLEYRPKVLAGLLAPPPTRTSAGADVGAIMTAIQQSDQDLKATMGLYEPSLGVRQGSAQSGKAIQALQQQGENANSNFLDNMGRAIRQTGRILVDLIPKIYDVTRVVRIIGTDDKEKQVMVHSNDPNAPAAPAPGAPPQLPDGIQGIYNLGMGRYDVVVSAAPSVETKRKEAFLVLSEFVTAYPAAFPVLGDLLVGSLDWPGAQAAAKRLERGLPPQFKDPEEGGQPAPPPEMVQQMQQMMQQLQEQGVELQQAQEVIRSKQIENAAKKAIEEERIAADVQIERMQVQLEQFKIQAEMAERRLEHGHDRAMAAQERVDNRADAESQRAHDQAVGAADRTHDIQTLARTHAREDAQHNRDRRDAKEDAPVEGLPPVDPAE